MAVSTLTGTVWATWLRRRAVGRTLAALLAGALVAVAALPVAAKVPGSNGRILYSNNDGVFVANPDGSHAYLLEANTCCAGWSPDGSHIALAANAPDGRVTTAIVAPDGSGYRLLPLPDGNLNLGPASVGSWSPDGARLALQGWDDSDSSQNGVYIVSAADGSVLKRVTSGSDLPEDFSPDGSMIVFSRFNPIDHGRSANFVVSVHGGPVRQISGWQGDQGAASWSPDGQWILTDNAKGGLYAVHPDGSGRHQIPLALPSRALAFTPSWSPDGTKIIFGLFTSTGPGTGQEGIYTANTDGSALVQVTTKPAASCCDNYPDWGTNPIVP